MSATPKVVDFSGVKDRGNFNTKRVAEGDYAARIVKVEDAKSKKSDTDQYVFTIKLEKFSQLAYPYYCVLQENQLWKLRNIGVAAGVVVPKKRIKFDPNKCVGKLIGVTMEDEEYEGKEKSVIAAVFPASDLTQGEAVDDDVTEDSDDVEDEEEVATPVAVDEDVEDIDAEEDEAPAPKKKKGKKKKKAE